jgi:hypothetical protein
MRPGDESHAGFAAPRSRRSTVFVEAMPPPPIANVNLSVFAQRHGWVYARWGPNPPSRCLPRKPESSLRLRRGGLGAIAKPPKRS